MSKNLSPITTKIIDVYFNPETGLTNAKNLYDHFKKSITLKKIKSVLENIKNKQIK